MIHCAIILTTTCANLSLISEFSPLKMNSSPDTAELDTTNHEKLLKFMREKSSRHFLEPLWGVGATASREYMTKKPGVHKGCLLCGSKAYICLGSTCLGSNLPMLDTCTKIPLCPNHQSFRAKFIRNLEPQILMRETLVLRRFSLRSLPSRPNLPEGIGRKSFFLLGMDAIRKVNQR